MYPRYWVYPYVQVRTVIGLVTGSKGIATGNKDIKIAGDISLEEALSAGPFDAVVLPGGMKGATTFATVSWRQTFVADRLR